MKQWFWILLPALSLLLSCQGSPESRPDTGTPSVVAREAETVQPVPFLVLTDTRCKECDPERFLEEFSRVVPGLKPRVLDWSDPEAKAIYRQLKLKHLPALLFMDSFGEHELFPQLAVYLDTLPGYYRLRVETDFDPDAEICDNGQDDTGNGLSDCADPACQGVPVCREEIRNHLQLFLMSQCPYGVVAQRSLTPLLANFGEGLGLELHYIVSEDETGEFHSLHGPEELEENERQLCAAKLYPAKRHYMDYIRCRIDQDEGDDWRTCTGSNGIDTELLADCVAKDGERLLREDVALTRALSFRASPTWLVNNRHEVHGLSPEAIRKAVCQYNPDLSGCENTLSDELPLSSGSCR